MPDDTGRSLARILRANLFTLFNGIVGASFLLLLLLGAWQDALFGFFVVTNTLIGVVQEFRAKRTLARFAVLNASRALVRRDGADVECAVEDVVLDDLLVLRPGGQIVADAELVDGSELEVDESLLTGEANPVSARVGRALLSGSTVVAGGGLARVNRVGTDSYSAKITLEAREFSLVRSELRESIARIIRWISLGLIPVGAIVVNGQMQAAGGWAAALSSGAWRDAAVAAVASIIAMVPQGLVFMTSLALTIGAVRLARRRVLVQELSAVEGLARVDMLCVDKTGTLTEGTLTLDELKPVEHPAPGWQQALAWFATEPGANTTTQAMAAAVGPPIRDYLPDATVPFSSRYKWSAAYFREGESPGTWVLGGADVVLGTTVAGAAEMQRQVTRLASAGRRTVVLAHSPYPLTSTVPTVAPALPKGLEPVAVVVLRERVRADAAETIGYFGSQGVQVCVISGDDPLTVGAVAHEIGLPAGLVAVDARSLPTDPVALAEVLRTERVFGRVTPQQKKAMVLALQSLGYTVAMTGDGKRTSTPSLTR
ncbi:HAD-IC family P-type ATPase [Subtercola boreus]|nr:HAD-IC family P-type ATPase [Subtercola boreus]